jgi:hypothetical protein
MYGSFEIPKDIVFETEVNEQGQASPVVASAVLSREYPRVMMFLAVIIPC